MFGLKKSEIDINDNKDNGFGNHNLLVETSALKNDDIS
jgi:hypothetical protein